MAGVMYWVTVSPALGSSPSASTLLLPALVASISIKPSTTGLIDLADMTARPLVSRPILARSRISELTRIALLRQIGRDPVVLNRHALLQAVPQRRMAGGF